MQSQWQRHQQRQRHQQMQSQRSITSYSNRIKSNQLFTSQSVSQPISCHHDKWESYSFVSWLTGARTWTGQVQVHLVASSCAGCAWRSSAHEPLPQPNNIWQRLFWLGCSHVGPQHAPERSSGRAAMSDLVEIVGVNWGVSVGSTFTTTKTRNWFTDLLLKRLELLVCGKNMPWWWTNHPRRSYLMIFLCPGLSLDNATVTTCQ